MSTPLCTLGYYLRCQRAELGRRRHTGVIRVLTVPGTIEHHAFMQGSIRGRYRFGWQAQLRIWWTLRHRTQINNAVLAIARDPVADAQLRAALWQALGEDV